MSAAVESVAFVWHGTDASLEVDRVLGGGGRLLVLVGDEGDGASIDLPERAVAELIRALVEHCRERGLETGDGYVDAYGVEL